MNMKIIVTENQFGKIMEVDGVPSETLLEQVAVANEENALTIVQQKINDLISDPKKEKALLDGINIQLIKGKETFILQIGAKKYPMNKIRQGVYAVIIPAGKGFSFATIPMSSFAAEIEKIPEYKSLVEKHPELKAQIQAGKVLSQLYTDKVNQGHFKFVIRKDLDDRKEEKMAIPINKPYPLGEFFERNHITYKFPGGLFGVLESGNLMADIISTPLKFAPPAVRQQPIMAPINVETMALADVFTFGDVTFKDEARVNQQIQMFIQQIKGYIEKYGTPFVEHLARQNPTVHGFSSRDGDPNQEIVGDYKPCSGNRVRKDYNLCLSTERAKVISTILNQSLPELSGAFQAKGMGETTRWGPGWTKESPTLPEQTAPNRRYLLGKIKPYSFQPPVRATN